MSMTLRVSPKLWQASFKVLAILAAMLAGIAGGCAGGSGPGDAFKQLTRVDYAKPYIGMGQQEVLNCAGKPRSRIPAGGGGETLIYHYNGAGPVPGGSPKDANCTASLTFNGGKLKRVNYAHVNTRSPYAYQSERDPVKAEALRREEVPSCVFSLPRCPR